MTRIGIIGIGRIGGGVVRSLDRSQDCELVAYDLRAEALEAVAAHASAAGSPREAGEGAEVVFVAVFDDAQVREALSGPDGVFAAERRPRAVVILSTVTLATITWAAEEGAKVGVAVLDCGVTGGGAAIEDGTIVALIGGGQEDYEFAKPYIEGFADPALYMGELGAGMKAKLARNLLTFGVWYAVAEAARLAAAAGVDIDQFVQASDAGDACTGGPTALLKLGIRPHEKPEDEAAELQRTGFVTYAQKDLAAALELARANGLELPGAELVLARFPEAVGMANDVAAI